MKTKLLIFSLLASQILFSCSEKEDPILPPPVQLELEIQNTVAEKWAAMTLRHIFVQPAKTPTYVSRSLGYIGLTMYETVAPGSIIYQSIAPQLNGMINLPKTELNKKYDWETSLNTGQAYIIKKMWQHSLEDDNKRLDSLEVAILNQRKEVIKDTAIINRSQRFGLKIAEIIYNWSLTDGGHLGYLKNFETSYKYPEGDQYWVPPLNGQSPVLMPLHPNWGKNRTFSVSNSMLAIPQIIPFSTDKNSANFKEFQELYDIQLKLTQEQKEIANWWGDDPSDTYAPSGHSYSLALQLINLKKTNLFVSAMTFAKVGMATADAFINCWKCKYTYHSLRPMQFIRKNINGAFTQYWPEPPFPAFASGHSTQSSATAEVLISVFGDNVSFDDNTHVGRPKDIFRNVEYKKRSFTSISQTAIECGISRLYGGIHTRQDNEIGLAEGKKVGANINGLTWKITK